MKQKLGQVGRGGLFQPQQKKEKKSQPLRTESLQKRILSKSNQLLGSKTETEIRGVGEEVEKRRGGGRVG